MTLALQPSTFISTSRIRAANSKKSTYRQLKGANSELGKIYQSHCLKKKKKKSNTKELKESSHCLLSHKTELSLIKTLDPIPEAETRTWTPPQHLQQTRREGDDPLTSTNAESASFAFRNKRKILFSEERVPAPRHKVWAPQK